MNVMTLDTDLWPMQEDPPDFPPQPQPPMLPVARASMPAYPEPPCATSPDSWFEPEHYAEAKAICADCPVREPCLRVALLNQEEYGVFGGMTPNERKASVGALSPLAVAVRTTYLAEGLSGSTLGRRHGISRIHANRLIADLRGADTNAATGAA